MIYLLGFQCLKWVPICSFVSQWQSNMAFKLDLVIFHILCERKNKQSFRKLCFCRHSSETFPANMFQSISRSQYYSAKMLDFKAACFPSQYSPTPLAPTIVCWMLSMPGWDGVGCVGNVPEFISCAAKEKVEAQMLSSMCFLVHLRLITYNPQHLFPRMPMFYGTFQFLEPPAFWHAGIPTFPHGNRFQKGLACYSTCGPDLPSPIWVTFFPCRLAYFPHFQHSQIPQKHKATKNK